MYVCMCVYVYIPKFPNVFFILRNILQQIFRCLSTSGCLDSSYIWVRLKMSYIMLHTKKCYFIECTQAQLWLLEYSQTNPYGSFHSHGTPKNRKGELMTDGKFIEKWMMTGASPILGNLHMVVSKNRGIPKSSI